jgi:hypothetical protein
MRKTRNVGMLLLLGRPIRNAVTLCAYEQMRAVGKPRRVPFTAIGLRDDCISDNWI